MFKKKPADDDTVATLSTMGSPVPSSKYSSLIDRKKKIKTPKKVTFNLTQSRGSAQVKRRENRFMSIPFISVKSILNEHLLNFKLWLLLFSVWSVPFRISFPEAASTLILVSDLLFLLDIFRSFSTSYIDDRGIHVVSRKAIAKRYCRTSKLLNRHHGFSFILDFLSVVVINVVDLLISEGVIENHQIVFRSLAVLVQLDRYLSISHHFKMMEMSVNSDARQIALMKFMVTLGGAAHWIGCSWWVAAAFRDYDDTTWVFRYFDAFLPLVSGTTDADKLLLRYGFENPYDQYELSLYWGFQALTNLGYCDILPQNSFEMVYAYVLCMAQVGFYAYVLGNSTLFSLSKRDQTSDNFRKDLKAVEMYGSSRNLPSELVKKMKSYFEFQAQKANLEEVAVLGKMPAQIFDKISMHKNGHFILNCPIFENPPPQFITALVSSLEPKYIMPKEKLFRKGDMSREVCFVSSGSLEIYGDEEGKTFLNNVKNDGTSPSIVGDLSFFLIIPQPHMVMASAESDVSLFSLTKYSYTKALEKYPESHQVIVTSLLAEMGLDTNGDDMADKADVGEGGAPGGGGGKKKKQTVVGDDDDNAAALKATVRDALKKRLAAALYSMMDAAREGDADRVKAMLMRGLDINATDYDKRSTLHLSCAEGNSKVVELLIAEGANVHALDRYGYNALHYAVINDHSLIADLLSRNGAELNYKKPADALCAAAGHGKMDRIRVLVKYGIDVNCADFDGRTALHLASSQGNLRVVELLLSMEADVNKQDRWGHTPLDESVGKGHDLVAAALFARGGELNMSTAKGNFMKASREGDLAQLKLFVENGIDVDCTDYDISTALHVAAIADQPVAVDFLLSAKANVNARSRWGTSPLDEAIASESVFCCKLLAACGGRAYANASSIFAQEVAGSAVTLEEIRKEINLECITQSKRSRAMHKLKQLHAKLMEDVAASCQTFERQCKSIESAATRLGSSRLTAVGARDQFKESDLEFDDYDEFQHQDSILGQLLGYRGNDNNENPHPKAYGADLDDNYILNRFFAHPNSPKSLNNSPRSNSRSGPDASGSFFNGAAVEVPEVIGGAASQEEVVFTTMNQVMLSYTKIDSGLTELKRIYDSYAEGNNQEKINLFELECVLKASGLSNCSDASKDIMAQCNSFEGVDTPSNHSTDERLGKLDEQGSGTEMKNLIKDEETLDFEQLLSSQTAMDLFQHSENYVNRVVNKVGLVYQLARVTFNLLDSGKEGCVNVRKLKNNEDIMGELAHGEELFHCFNNMETIYPNDMAVVFARWVAVLDEDDKDDGHDLEAIGDDRSMDAESDAGSSRLSMTDADGTRKSGEGEDGTAEPRVGRVSAMLIKIGLKEKPKSLQDELLLRLSMDYADNIEGIFSAYDADRGGTIDMEEFTDMIHDLFGKTSFSKAEIESVFAFFDYDKTGELFKHVFQTKLVQYRDKVEGGEDEGDAEGGRGGRVKKDSAPTSWALVFDADTSRVVKFVDRLKVYAAFAYFLLVPYEIALVHGSPEGNSEDMKLISWGVDAILYVDMFVSFHKTYVNRRSVKVTNPVKIRKHYLAHGFSFDLLTCMPFDFITYIIFNPSYKVLRWFRLPRMFTVVEIMKSFKTARRKTTTNHDRIAVELGVFSFLLFALTHLPACMWFFLTNVEDEDTVLHNTKIETTVDGYWFSGYGVVSSNGWMFEQYMLSLYWVTGTISTMGQGAGELMPQNAKERIFTIFLMLLNLSIYAYILGAISQLFMIADEAMVEVREEVTLIESYIANNSFVSHLQGEIRDTVKGGMGNVGEAGMPASKIGASTLSLTDAKKIYDKLSHTLKVEVAKHTYFELLEGVSAFKGCNDNFMESISTVLTEKSFKPNTYVFRMNEPSSDFYVISSGRVLVLTEDEDVESEAEDEGSSSGGMITSLSTEKRRSSLGKGGGAGDQDFEGKELGEGDVMGEIPFFFDTRHTTSCKTYKKGYVTIFMIAKAEYKRLLDIYPDEEEQIGKNVLSNSSSLNIEDRVGGGSSDGGSQSGAGSSNGGGSSSGGGSSDGASSHDDTQSDNSASSAGTTEAKDAKLSEIAKAVERARKRETNERVFSMCSSAASGNLDELKKLCSSGVSLSEQGYGGRTPLHLAASEGQLRVVQWIVQHMQDINIKDNEMHSPLVDAIENGWDDLAKYLRSQGAELDIDFAAVMLSNAACDNDTKKLKLLFELGADPNVNVAGRVRGGARRRRSALHFASSGGNLEAVKLLMENWASLSPFDGWGGTPLADSIREKHSLVQEVLRTGGAKLKEKGLCTAAAKGDIETIKVMVMNGVDINIGNYIGRSMLHLACSNKHMNVIDYLLKLPGLNPNVVDWYGGTPSEDAARGGFDSVCATLAEVGGVRSGHPILEEDVKKIGQQRQAEKDKFYKKREAQKLTDDKRKLMLDELSMLCKIAMEDITNVRRLLDALTMSLAGRTWKKKEAIDKAPKPDLDEIVLYFLPSFQKFMVKKHALKLLKFYQFCTEFSNYDAKDVDEMMRIGQLEYDRYLDPMSPEFIAINPTHSTNGRKAVFDDFDGEKKDWEETKLAQLHCAFGQIADDLADVLQGKYLKDFYASREFLEVATSVPGRTWRVLKMCKRSRDICKRLEEQIAVPMQTIVKGGKLNDMYGGAKAFNLTMSEVSVDFQAKLLDTVEKIEVSALTIKNLHAKQNRKKSIMVKQNNPNNNDGGGRGGSGGEGGEMDLMSPRRQRSGLGENASQSNSSDRGRRNSKFHDAAVKVNGARKASNAFKGGLESGGESPPRNMGAGKRRGSIVG